MNFFKDFNYILKAWRDGGLIDLKDATFGEAFSSIFIKLLACLLGLLKTFISVFILLVSVVITPFGWVFFKLRKLLSGV